MPQIDLPDYGKLEVFLMREYGVACERQALPTDIFKMKQCPDNLPTHAPPGEVDVAKPILVASDYFILDGNHHWLGAKERGKEYCNSVLIRATFDESCAMIEHFSNVHHEDDKGGLI
jgi:hypothetical protein